MKKIIYIIAIIMVVASLGCWEDDAPGYARQPLSPEILAMIPKSSESLKLFSIDVHPSVIEDLRLLFEPMGHELTEWSWSHSSGLFGKAQEATKFVDIRNWDRVTPSEQRAFYEEYETYFEQFDAFVVTHSATLALLYEFTKKPIIIVNSTRYENIFVGDPEKKEWLDNFLKKGVAEGRIFIVSNNKGDQGYLKHQTGLDSKHIPSLSLYTHAQYTGEKEGVLLSPSRRTTVETTDAVQRGLARSGVVVENRELPTHYDWQDLYNYKAIIHLPYNISTMSIFEQYSANVPLFFPTKRFLKQMYRERKFNVLAELSFGQVFQERLGLDHYRSLYESMPWDDVSNRVGDLNNIDEEDSLSFWVDSADFYDLENMPFVTLFDSFEELGELLHDADFEAISRSMRAFNKVRIQKAANDWHAELENVIETL